MKRTAGTALSILLTLFILASCKSSPPSADPSPSPNATVSLADITPTPLPPEIADIAERNSLDYSAVTYTETFTLSSTLSLQVTAHYPVTGVAAIDEYYDSALESFKQSARVIAEEYGGDQYEGLYVIEEDFEITLNDGYLYSVHRVVYDFFGGAHPNHVDKCDVFSVTDGRRLGLDELFTVPRDEYLPVLLREIDAFIDDADADMYGFDQNVKEKIRENFPYETFCVTGNDADWLRFYFSPYKIAPYAAGTIVIPIPRSAIADILVLYE